MARINIMCNSKVLGTAISSAGRVTCVVHPSRFDRLATLEEAEAYCAEFNARGYGQPIYAKPAEHCRYNEQATGR